MKAIELQAKDLRAWGALMHAAWSASAEVFRAVVAAIELTLGKDQVRVLVCRLFLFFSVCSSFLRLWA